MPGFREAALRRRRETVGALADHRRAAGLSQTEIAARMGTSQSTIARLEAGEVDPRMSTLERYAEALGGRLDVALQFDPAPAIAPGLPLRRLAAVPHQPVHPFPVAPGFAPAATHDHPGTGPAMPGGPLAPGGPAAPMLPAAQVSSPPAPPPEGDAPRRPQAAPLPPAVADPPARPTQRRW